MSSFRLALLSLQLLCCQLSLAQHVYTDSFPTYDEYDYTILDPNSVYGSPYGGFSRATASRLAALPLHLPPVMEDDEGAETEEGDDDDDEDRYMQIRDWQGRLFACRVYHEDELDPSSLNDSMFDAPKLRPAGELSTDGSAAAAAAAAEKAEAEKTQQQQQATLAGGEEEASFQVTADGNVMVAKLGGLNGVIDRLVGIETKLAALKGVCGHIHLGWWSYEWCYETHVTQFHVDFDSGTEQLSVTDITSLGKYSARVIKTQLEGIEAPNPLAEDMVELARVEDRMEGGDICDATGKPRTTTVQLVCCSERVLTSRKGKMQSKSAGQSPEEEQLSAIHAVFEDPEQVCTYMVTVCTSVLCDDSDGGVGTAKAKSAALPKDNESVREILERTVGDTCLQSATGGWWTYEFCHGRNIRQFHEVIGSHKIHSSGATYTSRVVESEHILGKYRVVNDDYPNEDEWQHVVNVTEGRQVPEGSGNGAYFEVEYTGGDVCDHSDVTESAVIAGSVGEKKRGLERASSVRYHCGSQYDVSVNEDSTCHYIVDVRIPDLCRHALFQAPVSKIEVIKCLPVEEDHEHRWAG